MSDYIAPLADMRFVIEELIGLERIAALPPFGELSADLVDQVLEEAGKFGAEVLAPLNRVGDTRGARFEDGKVITPPGLRWARAAWKNSRVYSVAAPFTHGSSGSDVMASNFSPLVSRKCRASSRTIRTFGFFTTSWLADPK